LGSVNYFTSAVRSAARDDCAAQLSVGIEGLSGLPVFRRRELSFADAADRFERKPNDPSASCSSSTPLSSTGGAVANVFVATGGSATAFSKSGVGDPGLSCELSLSAMGEGRRPLTMDCSA